jgi:hypothetical protein
VPPREGEPLVDLAEQRTSSAEFNRMARSMMGDEMDLLDEAALKVRSRPPPPPSQRP